MAVTIKHLAQRCGLSVSAISKALNNYPDISEATRATVRKVADEMGYCPNAQARALKTNRTYNIGVVFEVGSRDGLLHSFFSSVLEGFKSEIESHGYDITFINRNVGAGQLTLLNHCGYRNLDGALIACVDFYNPEVVELSRSEVPCVTIDHLFASYCPCSMSDNRAGMHALVRHIASLGHKRIAFVHGELTTVTLARIAGFREMMAELGLPVRDGYIVPAVFHDPAANIDALKKLLANPEPPTCIMLTDDYSALGVFDAIRDMGLEIGKGISIAGYDGINTGQLISPKLTTYQQDTWAVGREAAKLLIQRIEQPNSPIPEPVTVTGKLLEGATVAQI